MATFKSDWILQRESGKQNTDIHQQRGALTGFVQEITIPAGMVADDVIELITLKPGEVIDPGSRMAYPALGASTTLSVGTAADDDKYRTAQSSSSAGQVTIDTNTATRTTADNASTTSQKVLLTVKGGTPTAGQKLYFFWHLVNQCVH